MRAYVWLVCLRGDVRNGSRAAVAGRQIAQPVYPQLRKYLMRSGTYASCQQPKSQTGSITLSASRSGVSEQA